MPMSRGLMTLTALLCAVGCLPPEPAPLKGAADLATDPPGLFLQTRDGFRAHHAASQLQLTVDLGGATLTSQAGDRAEVQVRGVGRPGRLQDTDPTQPTLSQCARPEVACSGDVRIRRGALTEWWRTTSNGFQQGFDVPDRPPGVGLLEVALSVPGRTAEVMSEGRAAALHAGSGAALTLRDLIAWDATGARLPARFATDGDGLALRVDDTGAVYPVTIDPVYTFALQVLTPSVGDEFGFGIGAADVDGDGIDDVAIIDQQHDGAAGANVGAVHVHLGTPAGLGSTPVFTFEGTESGAELGSAVVFGDFDGDGDPDLAVGEPLANGQGTADGRVNVFWNGGTTPFFSTGSSTVHQVLTGVAGQNGYCGAPLATGDVNGDGFDDLLVSCGEGHTAASNSDPGRVDVYLGRAGDLPATPSDQLDGAGAEDDFGFGLATGDVDGDGYDDVLVGAEDADPNGTSSGEVSLFLGGASGLPTAPSQQWFGSQTSVGFGAQVATGDANGDGFADVLVAAPDWTETQSAEGRVELYLGSSAGVAELPSTAWFGGDSNASLGGRSVGLASDGGRGVAFADVNGDGFDDLLMAAYLHDGGGTNAGRTTVVLGGAAGPAPYAQWVGDGVAGSYEGFGLARADVNGDGLDDLMLGAPKSATTGSVRVVPAPLGDAVNGTVHEAGSPDTGFSGDNRYRGSIYQVGSTTLVTELQMYLDPAAAETIEWGWYTGISATGTFTLQTSTTSTASAGPGWKSSGPVAIQTTAGDYVAVVAQWDGTVEYFRSSETLPAALPGFGSAVRGITSGSGSTLPASTSFSASSAVLYAQRILTAPVTDADGDGIFAVSDCDDGAATNGPGVAEVCDGRDNDCDGQADFAAITWASSTTSGTSSGIGQVKGNVYQVDQGVALHSVEFWFGATAGQTVNIGVWTRTGATGPFTLRRSAGLAPAGTSNAYQSFGALELPLAVGDEVLIAAEWDGSAAYDYTATGLSPPWGTQVGRVSGTQPDFPGDGWEPTLYSPGRYRMRLVTSLELDSDSDGSFACADCDDTDAAVSPLLAEATCDGLDNDCSAATLDAPDSDTDGYDVCGTDADCDDTDATVNPGITEATCDGVDNDCDATTLDAPDLDSDSYDICGTDADCDDTDPTLNPGVAETTCDGLDNDCSAATSDTPDLDGDGYDVCGADADCNDAVQTVNPGVAEATCDGVDNDCSAATSDTPDLDGDGYDVCGGDADCDDTAVGVNPGVTEVSCDGLDNDCSPATSDAPDLDSDGYDLCGTDADCDDTDASIFPGAIETCDLVDEDCNGSPLASYRNITVQSPGYGTEGFVGNRFVLSGSLVLDTFSVELDPAAATMLSFLVYEDSGSGLSLISSTTSSVSAGRAFQSSPSLALPLTAGRTYVLGVQWTGQWTAYYDGPVGSLPASTSFGSHSSGVYAWGQTGPPPPAALAYGSSPFNTVVLPTILEDDLDGDGVALCAGDCDDSDATTYPGATELCDGNDVDNDCDGSVPATETDDDGDGESECAGDCADGDPLRYSTSSELCDGIDNDCDSVVPVDEADADGDTFRICAADCDDTQSTVYPGATELCDGLDNDCNGSAMDDYATGALSLPQWLLRNARFQGGFFDATQSFTLTGFAVELDPVAPASATFGVYEDTGSGLTLLASGAGSLSAGLGMQPSPPLSVPIVAGNTYVFGVQWSGVDVTVWYDYNVTGPTPLVAPFGVHTAGAARDGGSSLPAGSSITSTFISRMTVAPYEVEDTDADGDGALACADCDEADTTVFDGAPELCDGLDNDCDGLVPAIETDDDGDGFDECAGSDCDDSDPTSYFGASELCDGLDNDCDGVVPSPEADGDGDTYSGCAGDCDDSDAAVNPAAAELCDGVDGNCSGSNGDAYGDLAGGSQFNLSSTFVGNRFLATVNTRIDTISYDGGTFAGSSRRFGVYESTSGTGGWTLIEEVTTTSGNTSPTLGTPVVAGRSYVIGVRWSGTNRRTTLAGPVASAIGSHLGGGTKPSWASSPTVDSYHYDIEVTLLPETDGDGDASLACLDCLDTDASVFPGAAEACDGLDTDCDGTLPASEADGDSDGSPACADCDDTVATTFPGAPEQCDGADNDCDGLVLADYASGPGANSSSSVTGFRGNRFAPTVSFTLDRFGMLLDPDASTSLNFLVYENGALVAAASGPATSLTNAMQFSPALAVPVVAGNDYVLAVQWTSNQAVDYTFAQSALLNAPAPTSFGTHTNGVSYSGASSPPQTTSGFLDNAHSYDVLVEVTEAEADGDGDGVLSCGDCDDTNATVAPGLGELCDGLDNDCDAVVPVNEVDGDGDGQRICAGDCDDTAASVFVGATEGCDGVDTDCDGVVPPGELADSDGDGAVACADCDDADALRYPGATEVCDGLDNDCNGSPLVPFATAVGTSSSTAAAPAFRGNAFTVTDSFTLDRFAMELRAVSSNTTLYFVVFEDTGSGLTTIASGTQVTDAVRAFKYSPSLNAPLVAGNTYVLGVQWYPSSASYWYSSTSSAGLPVATSFGSLTNGAFASPSSAPVVGTDVSLNGASYNMIVEPVAAESELDADADGVPLCAGDCDDLDATVATGFIEVCDGLDNDCDGVVPATETDDDGDGDNECGDGDCDDSAAATYVGATELCDGLDNDCDGLVPTTEADGDGDGVVACADCVDAAPTIYPGASEVCDGLDNDCTGLPLGPYLTSGNRGLSPTTGFYGNAFTVDTPFTLDRFSIEVTPGASTSFEFLVYEDTGQGYSQIASGFTTAPSGRAFVLSPTLGLSITAGDAYVLGVQWVGSQTTIHYDNLPGLPLATAFGTHTAGVAYTGSNAPPTSANLALDTFSYNTRVFPVDAQSEADTDSDGFPVCAGDCNDGVPAINPGAVEICNGGVDDDCDPTTGEGTDVDADGETSCTDCDDTDPFINTSASEVCDGRDTDCDGVLPTDEGDPDGDGWVGCSPLDANANPPTAITGPGDCDPNDATTYPGASEVCDGVDNDCDSVVPPPELDGDGDGVSSCAGDCDDADSTSLPGGTEICDGVDNDCNGLVPTNETDADGDGVRVCASDCNDANATVYPGAIEACDGLDGDCDGIVPADEADGDGDGQRICAGDCDDSLATVNTAATEICDGLDNDCDGSAGTTEVDSDGDGVLVCSGDCDDANASVLPGATEVCDGLDNDCNGLLLTDEVDADGDGVLLCASDCDDTNTLVFPGATEACDGLDNDCDGAVPANEADADGDGERICGGDCDDILAAVNTSATEACDGLDTDCSGSPGVTEVDVDADGVLACAGDCDDSDATVLPGGTELCDGLDNDCDGVIPAVETDGDGDGESACAGDCDDTLATTSSTATEVCDGADNDCDGVVPAAEVDGDGDGESPCAGDCDDAAATTSSAATELCDGVDNDCDGLVPTNEADADGDGVRVCASDCDDTNAAVFPGATEACDGLDGDCDGIVPADEADGDGDGQRICAGDCDDIAPTTYSTASWSAVGTVTTPMRRCFRARASCATDWTTTATALCPPSRRTTTAMV